jgi:hypothetical protein
MGRYRRCGGGVLISAALMLTGCDSGPRAPELVDTPVYQSKSEGFRFRVPEGWTQTASSSLPPGQFEGENFLVRYLVQSPAGGSTLQVLCLTDRDGTVDLAEHNAIPSFGVENWAIQGPAESLDVGGIEAQRMQYQGTLGGRTMHKEVLCARRGERIYSFVGLYSDGDEKAQLAIRRALDSLIWDA